MSGFTKGPWCFGRMLNPKNAPAIIGDGDSVVAILPGEWNHCSLVRDDANLIAAAPELYEAGKRVTDAFRAMGNAAGIVEVRDARIECEQAMLALDAALSKAAGEGR